MITKDSYEGELKKFRKYCRKHPNELGCYVYALADPTKGKEQVFYVGKGQKERMFNHILSSFKHKELSEEQLVGEKLERIQRVHNFGHKVESGDFDPLQSSENESENRPLISQRQSLK